LLSLWKKNVKECKKLPKIIIAGPSSTGSNVLIKFININRNLRTSENQTNFYTDEGYYKGFDWYLGSFNVQDQIQNYDRSDEYFSDPKVPERIHALVGEETKIILFLMNPIERAYLYYKV
jgi:hypothetical protein